MGSHTLELSPRPEIFSEPGADANHHFNVDSHCVVQLGTVVSGSVLAVNEFIVLKHDRLAPLYNLSLESEAPPDWGQLTIQAVAVTVPPPPGPGPPIPFIPSPDPMVLPALYGALPSPPIPPLALPGYAAGLSPGGFGHHSLTGSTVYGLRVSGSTSATATPGLKRHRFFIKGAYGPIGVPPILVGVIHLGLIVQVKDVFEQVDQVPPELQHP